MNKVVTFLKQVLAPLVVTYGIPIVLSELTDEQLQDLESKIDSEQSRRVK